MRPNGRRWHRTRCGFRRAGERGNRPASTRTKETSRQQLGRLIPEGRSPSEVLSRHSPDSRPVGHDPCEGSAATKFDRSRPGNSQNGGPFGLAEPKPAALPSSRRTSAAVVCRICPNLWSCWYGWCPQPGNKRQDVGEHLSRHCDLGHLERDVAAVADDLGTDLDQLLAQTGQRPRLRRLGIASVRMKLPRL
jgi:hypothetical protein